MSRTYKHKIQAKFNQGLIDYKDIPQNIKNMWNRYNFDWGKYRKQRIEKFIYSLSKGYESWFSD